MAFLKPVILPGKALKGGRHKIRIYLSHNGDVRYIVTNIIIDSANEFKNGQIVKRPDASYLNSKLRSLLQKYQSMIDEMDYVDGLTASEIVSMLKFNGFRQNYTIEEIYNEYIETQVIEGTKRYYTTCRNALCKIIPSSTPLSSINYTKIRYILTNLELKKYKPGTIRGIMAIFKTTINYAVKCGYVSYKINPFTDLRLPQATVNCSWLSVDEIKSIRDFQTNSQSVAKARDFFMLSYYLGGINMNDLRFINFNENVNTLSYSRGKIARRNPNNDKVEIKIRPEAKEIIEKYKGSDGLLGMTKSQRQDCSREFVRYGLSILRKELGIDNLVFYSARKSFAQHAFTLGINTQVIDYILGHKPNSSRNIIYSYIRVTPEQASEAIDVVLDNLK